MLRIGLTGGFACGKSAAAEYFSQLGIEVIDTDVIAHEVVQDRAVLNQLIAHYGRQIMTANDTLDRKYLRDLVFSNPMEKQWLENVLHPLILARMQQQAAQARSAYCVLAIPLLVEKSLQALVDRRHG
jgi:dephospho-CoA kinase